MRGPLASGGTLTPHLPVPLNEIFQLLKKQNSFGKEIFIAVENSL